MKIEIQSIKDKGILPKERLVLKANRNCNIGMFFVFDTTYTDDGNISNLVRHPYWFPDKEVSEGDTIVLYTKEGQESVKKNKNGTTSHFFYRDMGKTVWNQKGDCAVLFEIADWMTKGSE